jgi:N-acetylglutamate synthase
MTIECIIAQQLEERLINVWPSVSMLMMDGWAVRFAHGYSGRANSASAVVQGAHLPSTTLAAIEDLYSKASLAPQFRMTPVAHPSTESMLRDRGYRIKDEAHSMVTDLPSMKAAGESGQIVISPVPSRDWLEGVCRSQPPSKSSPAHLMAIVGKIQVPAAFAMLNHEETPVAFGLGVIDRGMAEIGCLMVDEAHRGRGLGRQIMIALMTWAKEGGARRAFLQVDRANANAVRLYDALGFAKAYDYKTLVGRHPQA